MLKQRKMKMPKSRKKEFGHKAESTEYCPGYVDQHGIWNNGFYCPKWGNSGQEYCCGDDNKRICCPMEDTPPQMDSRMHRHVPLIIGLAVGCAILLLTAIFVTCYFCRCCYVYKRRKRMHQSSCTMAHIPNNQAEVSVRYTACPHHYPELLGVPLDDPPPYPGHEQLPIEKIPLHQSMLTANIQTDTSGEDSPITHLPRYSQVILLAAAQEPNLESTAAVPSDGTTPPTPTTPPPPPRSCSVVPRFERLADMSRASTSAAKCSHRVKGTTKQLPSICSLSVSRGGESPIPELQQHRQANHVTSSAATAASTSSNSSQQQQAVPHSVGNITHCSTSSRCGTAAAAGSPAAGVHHACMCCHRSHVNTALRHSVPTCTHQRRSSAGSNANTQSK